MKKSKLKKLMLEARDTHRAKAQALDHLAAEILAARNTFARTKEQLKNARKQHRTARKNFRKLEKALKNGQSSRKEALETFARLEKKWLKLNKPSNKTAPQQKKKPVASRAKKRAPKSQENLAVLQDVVVSA
jgi:hypothetical protein